MMSIWREGGYFRWTAAERSQGFCPIFDEHAGLPATTSADIETEYRPGRQLHPGHVPQWT